MGILFLYDGSVKIWVLIDKFRRSFIHSLAILTVQVALVGTVPLKLTCHSQRKVTYKKQTSSVCEGGEVECVKCLEQWDA
jgi:hypothetical protein